MPGPPRAAVPNAHKLALRQYRRDNPLLKLSELAAWFHGEYGRTVTIGQVSSWLGPSYDRLDTSGDVRTDLKRKRPEKWPKLESALHTWMKWYEAKGGVVTAKVIRMMAERFWKRIDEYKDTPLPSLSNGWIDGFKARYGLKKRRRHGEVGSVNVDADDDDGVALAMEQIVPVTNDEALRALQVLVRYSEQQGDFDMVSMLQRHEDTLRQRQQGDTDMVSMLRRHEDTLRQRQQGNPDMVSMLQRHENTLRQREQASMRQSDISSWINRG